MEMKYFPVSGSGLLLRPMDRNPRNLLIFGITGSAKTTGLESYAEREYENGSKIIDIWDSKNDLEGAYRIFPPSEKQKRIMKALFGQLGKYEGRTYPTRVYHPLCRDIHKKLPDCFNIFSIPLNSISLSDISFLAENTKPTVSSRILFNVLKGLHKKTTLVDFFAKVNEMSRKSDVSMYFGQRVKPRAGTMKSHALKIFIEFHDEFTISSESNCLALTEEKLIKEMNDQKTFSIFSTKWVTDEKSKYFITLWIMNMIAKLKTEGKIDPKVVIILRDLHTLAPRFYNFDEQYKTVMVNKLYHILSTFRSKDIEIIADNQDPTTLNTRLVGQFPEILVGPVFTPSEVQYFAESGSFMDKNVLSAITGLRSHNMKKFYDVNSGEFVVLFFPRHRHKEAGDNFFKNWEKFYGLKRFKDWSNLIAESKLEMALAEKRVRIEDNMIIEEEKGEKIKIEKGLPQELVEMKEFVRIDVERVLGCGPENAGGKLRKWKREGFIEMIGEATSKNVKYKVL